MTDMTERTWKLTSCKGTRMFRGSKKAAIAEARKWQKELQAAFGVDVVDFVKGETVCNVS